MSFLNSLFGSQPPISYPDEWLDHDASQLDYVVIDCEMTGLNPRKDKLLSIAAVKISKGHILTDYAFYEVIQQDPSKLKTETILIHRLNHEMIASGKDQNLIIEDLYKFCQGCIPVGHFFDIDLSFLPKDKYFSYPHLDTRDLAHALLRKHPSDLDLRNSLQLENLIKLFSLPSFTAHHALSDVCSTACLFLKLLQELKSHKVITLKSFCELR